MNSKRIVVVGSANQDYLVRVSHRPGGGETTIARRLVKQPGGKGANQAVAAARLGGAVHFVGAVGRDDDGASILRSLQKDGASVDDVRIVDGVPTGLALILVDDAGENSITVVSGANETVTADRAAVVVRRLASSGAIVVLQGELPVDVLEETARAASAVGARVILNLAPYREVAADVLAVADPVVLNETETSQLLGERVSGVDAARGALEKVQSNARSVVITLGAQGAVWTVSDRPEGGVGPDDPKPHVAAAETTDVVDTTGAGDAFVGALAFALSVSDDLGRAVELGTRAGTFAIRGVGAQSSYARAADLGLTAGS
ncbi:ribokinase [Frondihabitans sucicola]|uniref:Ribokinase n=1 Tax=Frondihabitans sucicola TaxID=1268041 RepID=A0ABM8GT30_9MICO|nr:ribokinase [Frondihabitans sucicola]BDZ51627.1 ribokinase [Frondihabitans sucicola]